MSDLGQRIKEAAESVGGLNQLAELSSVPRRTLGDFVAGKTEPKASVLGQIANITGVELKWLLLGHGQKKPEPSDLPPLATTWVNMIPSIGAIVSNAYREAGAVLPEHRLFQEITRWQLAMMEQAGGSQNDTPAAIYSLLSWVEEEIVKELREARHEPGSGKRSAS